MALVVANPRRIQPGVHIFTTKDGRRWFEGEAFTGSITKKQEADLKAGGYLING